MKDEAPYIAREVTYFGFGLNRLEWGERREVTLEPKRSFHPERIYVPSTCVGYLIEILICGERITRGLSPVELLCEVSSYPQVQWPRIGPGRPVTFILYAPPPPRLPSKWARFWNWIRRRPAPKCPPFTGAFYGSCS